MRNLAQYPVTRKEIIEYLESLLKEQMDVEPDKMKIGGMGPMLLSEAIKIIKSAPPSESKNNS
jgi:hypothetical protein